MDNEREPDALSTSKARNSSRDPATQTLAPADKIAEMVSRWLASIDYEEGAA